MHDHLATRQAIPLVRTPNLRRRAQRRRLAVVAAMAGLAVCSGLAGILTAQSNPAPVTGPFSYFPAN